jgi:hypothetical protein
VPFHAANCSTGGVAGTSGAKALLTFVIFHGAEAPLFHGIPGIRDVWRIRNVGRIRMAKPSGLSVRARFSARL